MASPAWKEHALPFAAGLAIAGLVFAGVDAARRAGLLRPIEERVYDRWVDALPKANSSPCVIVRVSEPDIRSWNQYPMSDPKMADLLKRLKSMGARVIALDIFRDVNTPDLGPGGGPYQTADNGRAELDRLLSEDPPTDAGPHVVAGYLLDTGDDYVRPPPVLAGAWDKLGFLNLSPDPGPMLRRGALFRADPDAPGEVRYGLAAMAVDRYFAADATKAERITLLPSVGPDDLFYGGSSLGGEDTTTARESGRPKVGQDARELLLDFRGPRHFPRFDVEPVLAGRVDAGAVRGKIVFVGVIAPSIKDTIATPLDDKFPGVEVHAQIADQLIRMADGAPAMTSAPRPAQWAVALAVGLVGWLIGWTVRNPWVVAGCVAALCVASVGTAWLGLRHHTYLAVVPPALGALLTTGLVTSYRSYRERQDRQVMDSLVDRMMSKRIARTLWSRRSELLEGGHLKPQVADATVIFSDLQSFTPIAERLDAPVLLKWLNAYFQRMSDLVESNGGIVNKYVGDQIMAVFGPPLPSDTPEAARENALRGVRCAVEMRAAMDHFRTLWRDRTPLAGWTDEESRQLFDAIAAVAPDGVFMRVGLCSGPLVAGSLGSHGRLEYTVVGPVVNLASRLESWDKTRMGPALAPGGCRILMNAEAARFVAGEIEVTHLGGFTIRGVEGPVDIYGVPARVLETGV